MKAEPRAEVTIPVSIRLTPDDLQFVDNLAREIGIARSTAVRNIFQAGLEDARMLRAVGILPTALKLMEVKDKLKEGMAKYLNSLKVQAN